LLLPDVPAAARLFGPARLVSWMIRCRSVLRVATLFLFDFYLVSKFVERNYVK